MKAFLFRFWVAPDQFEQIDYSIRKFLFLFACTNSCANPLIYGLFADKKASIFNSRERICFLPNGRRKKWRNVSVYLCSTYFLSNYLLYCNLVSKSQASLKHGQRYSILQKKRTRNSVPKCPCKLLQPADWPMAGSSSTLFLSLEYCRLWVDEGQN